MDLERFSELTQSIYGSVAAPDRWPAVLDEISAALRGVGGLMLYSRDDGAIGTICSPGLREAQKDYEAGEWWRHDIRFTRSERLGYMISRNAITDRHIATDDEIETLPYYTEFLHRHGLKWFGGISISPDPKVSVALSILRSREEAPFSDEELVALAHVGRHVENALRLGIHLIGAQIAAGSLADTLARLGIGVFLLDRKGRVVFRNTAADALLGDHLAIQNQVLTGRSSASRSRLAAAIASTLSPGDWGASGSSTAVPISAGERLIVLNVLPVGIPEGESVKALFADATTIVVATSSAEDDPMDPALLQDVFDLTLGEARVAALVGAGLTPQAASERLQISKETVRTVLRRVFAKVGVSRQSELTRLISRLSL